LGQKVAIVSDKPQTTRNRIHCVLTGAHSQVVFLDTPGIHKPQHKLGKFMVDTALAAWQEVDGVLFLVDGAAGIGSGDEYIAGKLAAGSAPVFVAVNKTDRLDEAAAAAAVQAASALGNFHTVLPISALTGHNVDKLVAAIIATLPPGPKYYPDDMITDHPEQFIVAELVREQILQRAREEVPHAVAVQVEQMAVRPDRDLVDISVVIYVERESQKKILIGKAGTLLKQVGSAARKEIEALLGMQAFLQLHVKVQADWRDKDVSLRRFGYNE